MDYAFDIRLFAGLMVSNRMEMQNNPRTMGNSRTKEGKEMTKTKSVNVSLPKKVLQIVNKLVNKGDYKNISDFLTEASRSHIRTWYPSLIEK